MNRSAGFRPEPGAFAALAFTLPLAAPLALAAQPDATAAGAKRGCRAAEAPAAELSAKALRRSFTCVINKERSSRERHELEENASLKRVAKRHAERMVADECLGHTCPGERPLEQRVRRSGYPDGADRWRFASNTGCADSAKAMLRSWLHSEFHRENVLDPRFRDLGVGVERTAPESQGCESDFATFAVVFGRRQH